jgi:hypothetical protein
MRHLRVDDVMTRRVAPASWTAEAASRSPTVSSAPWTALLMSSMASPIRWTTAKAADPVDAMSVAAPQGLMSRPPRPDTHSAEVGRRAL